MLNSSAYTAAPAARGSGPTDDSGHRHPSRELWRASNLDATPGISRSRVEPWLGGAAGPAGLTGRPGGGASPRLLSFGKLLERPIVDEDGNRHDAVALRRLHDRDAARGPSVSVDPTHLGAQDRSELGDEHELLVLAAHEPNGRNRPGVRVQRVGDDAACGAVLDREIGDIGSLAE